LLLDVVQILTTAAITDDDRDTVAVFAEYLQMYKIDVVAVGYDGKNAVDIYKKYKPDIMFLDILMPQYDGIYALKEIRAIDSNAKVVVITADLNKYVEEKLSELKPTKIFIKPFDMSKIIDLLEKLEEE
jgi:two-component system chemotaxis response regulator CheY